MVRQETIVVLDDEGTMEGEVHLLKRKKRGGITPRQPDQIQGSAHSSPHPHANKVTYYFVSFFLYP